MRHPYLLLSLSLLSLSFSCSSDLTEEITTPSHQVNTPMATPTDETLFPQEMVPLVPPTTQQRH